MAALPLLVGIDDSARSMRALLWAAHEAWLRHAPLRVVHVPPFADSDIAFSPAGVWEEGRERGRGLLSEAAALVKDAYPDLEVDTAMLTDGHAAAVLRRESENAQLVALGSKGAAIGHLLAGSVALQLAGHAACPVVVVPHVAQRHDRVVVGTDGSDAARGALAFAFEEAEVRGARLDVLTAEPVHDTESPPGGDPDASYAAVKADMEKRLASLREEHPDVVVGINVRAGGPVHALARESSHADMIVMGSRGHGGFHGLALGSAVHKVLHFAECPIVVVRA